MMNEFVCALKPKAYTKIVQASMKSIIIKLLAFNLKRIIFIRFRYGFCQALAYLYCDLVDAFPWSQPSSQSTKTFLRSALTLVILHCLAWLQVSSPVSNLPRSCNFIQYNSFFQKIFFDLNIGFGVHP